MPWPPSTPITQVKGAGRLLEPHRFRFSRRWARALRAFTHGHAQQLNAVLRQTLIRHAERVLLLPGADEVVFVDLDSTHRQVYGYVNRGLSLRPFEPQGQKQPISNRARVGGVRR
jgi:hypothetical protein